MKLEGIHVGDLVLALLPCRCRRKLTVLEVHPDRIIGRSAAGRNFQVPAFRVELLLAPAPLVKCGP